MPLPISRNVPVLQGFLRQTSRRFAKISRPLQPVVFVSHSEMHPHLGKGVGLKNIQSPLKTSISQATYCHYSPALAPEHVLPLRKSDDSSVRLLIKEIQLIRNRGVLIFVFDFHK
jgi:hypothetical protein